jgi:hypothetical protein
MIAPVFFRKDDNTLYNLALAKEIFIEAPALGGWAYSIEAHIARSDTDTLFVGTLEECQAALRRLMAALGHAGVPVVSL